MDTLSDDPKPVEGQVLGGPMEHVVVLHQGIPGMPPTYMIHRVGVNEQAQVQIAPLEIATDDAGKLEAIILSLLSALQKPFLTVNHS